MRRKDKQQTESPAEAERDSTFIIKALFCESPFVRSAFASPDLKGVGKRIPDSANSNQNISSIRMKDIVQRLHLLMRITEGTGRLCDPQGASSALQ